MGHDFLLEARHGGACPGAPTPLPTNVTQMVLKAIFTSSQRVKLS